jgi:hypothetical protein
MKQSRFKQMIREEINRVLNEAVIDKSVPGKYIDRTSTGDDATKTRSNPPNITDQGYIGPVDKTMFGVIKRLGLKAAEAWFREHPRGIGSRARYSWPIFYDRFQRYKKYYEQWAKQHGMAEAAEPTVAKKKCARCGSPEIFKNVPGRGDVCRDCYLDWQDEMR